MNFTYEERQVQGLHEAGSSIRTIANHLGIDKSKVQRIIGKLQKVTSDSVNDTLIDTQGETRDTGYVSLTDTLANRRLDTLQDTVQMAMRQPNNQINTVDTPQKRCSLGVIGLLTRQVGILKEDINDFITDTAWLNQGDVSILYTSYQLHLRRVRRLIQSIILLTDQLGVDYRNLLVTQVLQSIQAAIEEDFSEEPMPELLEATNVYIPQRDTKTWLDVLRVDFLHPSNQ